MRVLLCTVAALCCFAANSLLARAALGRAAIDPASFTALRLASGALVLALLVRARRSPAAAERGSWLGGAALFAYAIAFSAAYVRIGAGTGALILFAAVQVSMIARGLWGGERPCPAEWAGMALALGGLLWLTAPGLQAPDALGALGMTLAGVAWAVYTLLGRRARNPLRATAGNFARSLVPAALVLAATAPGARAEPLGIACAAASGALASGLGYAIWYAALPHLTATRAAIVQLAVPALTAAGAVGLLGETLTLRLVAASALIFAGIVLAQRGRRAASTAPGAPALHSPRRP